MTDGKENQQSVDDESDPVQKISEHLASVSIKKSNRYYADRHERYCNILKETLVVKKDAEVSQEEILSLLELGENSADKRIATKVVTDSFPEAIFSRRKLTYKNITRSVLFEKVQGEVKPQGSSNIKDQKDKIALSSQMIDNWRKEIMNISLRRETDMHQIRATLLMYDNEVQKFSKLHQELDDLYETEVKRLMKKNDGDILPQSVQDKMNNELTYMCNRVNFGLRNPDEQVGFLLTDDNSENLRVDFHAECPVLWNVMRSFFPVDTEGHTRKKELSFAHAISILMSLKNGNMKNDIKLCFSLLLQSYGVGCRLMNFLAKMAITYSWETLGTYLESYIENKILSLTLKTR